jgi:type III pantothenate kinase
VDRLLCGYAASKIYGPPLLVIDCGTALTFNWVDEKGDFRGGAIAAGLGLSAAGLAKGCVQLPHVPPSPASVPLLGEDTPSAIHSGLVHGYAGMVEAMTRKFLKDMGRETKVVVTGGEAVYVIPNQDLFPIHDPDLLLKGIALAYEESSSPAPD